MLEMVVQSLNIFQVAQRFTQTLITPVQIKVGQFQLALLTQHFIYSVQEAAVAVRLEAAVEAMQQVHIP
jgi:hypothetical protein